MRPRLGPKNHQYSPIRAIQWYRAVIGVYWVGQREVGRFLDRIIHPSGADLRRTCMQPSLDSAWSELKMARKRLRNG